MKFTATHIIKYCLAFVLISICNTLYAQDQPVSLPVPQYAGQRIAQAVTNTLRTLTHSYYKYGGNYINKLHGVYAVDCSAYVDHILNDANLSAFKHLTSYMKTAKPSSRDYYSFFKQIPYNTTFNDWYHIKNVAQLRAGDIIVYRAKRSGHVMIVVDAPQPLSGAANIYYVRVSDSASSGHGDDDTRGKKSGIGIGTLLLKTNNITDTPVALSWEVGAHWQHALNFAMARPIS